MTAEHNDGENTLFIRDNTGEYYGLPVRDLMKYRLSEEQAEALEAELAKPAGEVSGYMPIYVEYSALNGMPSGGGPSWVPVSSLQWGVGRGISLPTGG